MKRIEKEIKKNSAQLIESSLPEISSLDSIHVEAKKHRTSPLLFVPLGAAALLVTALLLPTVMKSDKSKPSYLSSSVSSVTSQESSVINRYYDFNLEGYTPKFDSINEAVYYSYFAYEQGKDVDSNSENFIKRRLKQDLEDYSVEDQIKTNVVNSYNDAFGRLHLQINDEMTFTVSNFLYFEFDSQDNVFLDERIGNGHIYGLCANTDIYDNIDIIILKNGDKYLSCLQKGFSLVTPERKAFLLFNSSSVIDGYEIVMDALNERRITLNFDDESETCLNRETICSIDIEGEEFNIIPDSVFYDETSAQFTITEIASYFDVNPIHNVVPKCGERDALAYDVNEAEEPGFTLVEYEDTFSIAEDDLYLGEEKLVTLNGATKIYASDINKDAIRDIVFEYYEEDERMLAVYDAYRHRYLLNKPFSEVLENCEFVQIIRSVYDYSLCLKDNNLVIKMLEVGQTTDEYVLDIGSIAYIGLNELGIRWKNIYYIDRLRIANIYEEESSKAVKFFETHYRVQSNVQYIVELELCQYFWGEPDPFLGENHPVTINPFALANMPNKDVEFNFLSYEDGVYRYSVTFPESGYSYYNLSFYMSMFELRVAVDYETDNSKIQ